MIFILIPLALLALTAGMFLLAKTRKENLGKFFKAISYFIIIASFLIMCLTLIGGFTRMLMHRMHHMENHERMMPMQHYMHDMRGRFSPHEEMRGMNRWSRMNKMQDGGERDTIQSNENNREHPAY
jgi:ABC-type lipoprotein release transport system permease subunit